MADQRRVGGLLTIAVNGQRLLVRGNWTYSIGESTRETITGADGPHGYKEMPRASFIEGEITDRQDVDMRALARTSGATVTGQLANGKVIALRDAWAAGDWVGNTEEGNVTVRFEGASLEIVRNS